jgi:hypothetical protein
MKADTSFSTEASSSMDIGATYEILRLVRGAVR